MTTLSVTLLAIFPNTGGWRDGKNVNGPLHWIWWGVRKSYFKGLPLGIQKCVF
jgi:hypothetical protein